MINDHLVNKLVTCSQRTKSSMEFGGAHQKCNLQFQFLSKLQRIWFGYYYLNHLNGSFYSFVCMSLILFFIDLLKGKETNIGKSMIFLLFTRKIKWPKKKKNTA